MARIPTRHYWVFWDVEASTLDPRAHANYVLPRILEFGGIAEVRWAIRAYGMDRIHRFLREVGHPELTARTLCFWRAALDAQDETWESPPAWRASSGVPWLA